ncbi:hypothetical protein BH23ACT10_BH23ACT10_13370 [soil metagenome]
MTWQTGSDEIEGMVSQGELEHVGPSDELAERFFEEAARHLASAQAVRVTDPTGSYQLAYDAARKACAALLAVQGLRATSAGGHIAVQDVVRAQFRGVFARFPELRRVRRQSECPNITTPTTTVDDASFAIDVAADMLNSAQQLVSPGASTRSDFHKQRCEGFQCVILPWCPSMRYGASARSRVPSYRRAGGMPYRPTFVRYPFP